MFKKTGFRYSNLYWRLKRKVQTWINKFPLMWKSEHNRILSQELGRKTTQFNLDIEKERAKCDELIKNISSLQWRRDQNVYRLALAFDADLIRMYGPYSQTREDLTFLGEMIARQVAHEIASSKFIQKADEEYVPMFRNKWNEQHDK